jgi:hypothetical protein
VDGWHGYTGLKTQTLLVVASGAAGLLEMLFVCAVDRCPLPDKGRYLRLPNVLADAGLDPIVELLQLKFPLLGVVEEVDQIVDQVELFAQDGPAF